MANELRQIKAAIQNPFPLPAEYLFPGDANSSARKSYENMSQSDKIINGGKLWSMYDLMKYFHSGFMPTNNDANYIEYEIDFTQGDIAGESKTDPIMVNLVKTKLLEAFQPLSSKVESQFASDKSAILAEQTGILSKAVMSSRVGGAEFDGNNQYVQQPMQQMQQPMQQMQQLVPAIGAMFNGNSQSILSPESLTNRCLTSIGGITFNSLNRIFVTRTFASLPLVAAMDGKPIVPTADITKLQFVQESQAGGINHKNSHTSKTRRHRSRRRERRERERERAERERE